MHFINEENYNLKCAIIALNVCLDQEYCNLTKDFNEEEFLDDCDKIYQAVISNNQYPSINSPEEEIAYLFRILCNTTSDYKLNFATVLKYLSGKSEDVSDLIANSVIKFDSYNTNLYNNEFCDVNHLLYSMHILFHLNKDIPKISYATHIFLIALLYLYDKSLPSIYCLFHSDKEKSLRMFLKHREECINRYKLYKMFNLNKMMIQSWKK